ncbi:MAG: response regulator [Geobacteraceae bacterium]|nr:response regulator [Geobacteraceae bacterium]
MSNHILLVDDEVNVLSALTRALFDEPYQVTCAKSGEEALELIAKTPFKLVVSDERMIGMQGSELLAILKDKHPDTLRILLTGHATLEAAMKAVNQGEIYRFFTKPWNDTELKFAIRSAIERYDLEAENRRLLATVKNQAMEIKVLEKRYPGISRVEKDELGSFVLPDLSEAEIRMMMAECEKEAV